MARPFFDYEGAARILAEAALFGDKRTAERNKITTQTIRNYRKRLTTDERLPQLLAQAKQVLTARWADRLVPAILRAVDYIECAVAEAMRDKATLKNPDMLHAVTGSMKLLSDTAMGERMLDARLSGANRVSSEAAGSLAAREEGSDEEPRH